MNERNRAVLCEEVIPECFNFGNRIEFLQFLVGKETLLYEIKYQIGKNFFSLFKFQGFHVVHFLQHGVEVFNPVVGKSPEKFPFGRIYLFQVCRIETPLHRVEHVGDPEHFRFFCLIALVFEIIRQFIQKSKNPAFKFERLFSIKPLNLIKLSIKFMDDF